MIGVECKLYVVGYTATISLDRPEKKNALGRQMLQELNEAITYCNAHCRNPERAGRHEKLRCVVLSTAVDKIFCAGADLKERKEMTPDQARDFVIELRRTFCRFEDLPVPTIAAIDGHALGGGLELALSADLRVVDMQSNLGLPETSLGIVSGAGGTFRLARAVGLPKAKELGFTSKPVKSEEAFRIGLVNAIASEGTAYDRALAMASDICANGPVAVQACKAAMNSGFGLGRDAAMALEKEQYDRVLATKDRLEGLAAFAQKRKPEYTGE
jgi:methylglutaconyl-CoA hydratase